MTMVLDRASYRHAIRAVKAKVETSGTSFHAGMAILSKPRREAMYAFYAFCREVDDIADDSMTSEISARGLQEWRQRITQLFRGVTDDNPITVALMPVIERFRLTEKDFQDIIDGMAMDAAVFCAPDEATLDLYCDRVASAVGRVSVRIFGDDSPDAMQVAHYLGRAFQLTNILRDLAEDAARGRLYLPEELLAQHGITSRLPNDVLHAVELPAVCRDLAARAHGYFELADNAMRKCKLSAMRPARVMRGYYGAIFDRLVAADWRDPTQRISLPKWQKIWLALRYLAG